MYEPHQTQRGFFDTAPAVTPATAPTSAGFFSPGTQQFSPGPARSPISGFPAPPVPPLPKIATKLVPDGPTRAPIPVVGPAKPQKSRRAPSPAVISTWLVGIPALLFSIVLAPANPAFGVFVLGLLGAFTAAYALVSGRSSWLRLGSRSRAVAPLLVSVALVAGAGFLPQHVVVAPKFLTAPPTPTAEQSAAVVAGFSALDPRMATEVTPEQMVSDATAICLNDFAAQTPEQQVVDIESRLQMLTEPKQLTPEQARGALTVVRATFCGEPGSREQTVDSEVVWSIPGLQPVVVAFYDAVRDSLHLG